MTNARAGGVKQSPRTRAQAVVKAAMSFWRQHKPIDWTHAQHVARPIVNMTATQRSVNLARACARLAAAKRKGKRYVK